MKVLYANSIIILALLLINLFLYGQWYILLPINTKWIQININVRNGLLYKLMYMDYYFSYNILIIIY